MFKTLHIKTLLIFILACRFISTETYAQQPELKHSYTFDDGTAKDVIGNADGLLKGGKIEDGKYFTTADGQYIQLPGNTINIKSYNSLSLEAYIIADEAARILRIFALKGR